MLRFFRAVGVAILFAICGAGSSLLLSDRLRERMASVRGFNSDLLVVAVGMPFTVLSVVLFWRNSQRSVLAAPIVVMTWLISYMAAMAAGIEMGAAAYIPMSIGGLIGGVGLYICDWIVSRNFRPMQFAGMCIAGAVSALFFGPWLTSLHSGFNGPDPLQPFRFARGFAVWQAVMGTYLFTINKPYCAPKEDMKS